VIFKHAFRNALLSIITNIGLYLPAFIGGVVVVETVFTWGGLGYAFSQAINGGGYGGFYGGGGDIPTLQALVMLSAAAVTIANLIADLSYAWLDPRIRDGSRSDD
jgi:ABC-type dipeptide/oligopeptide/nickel transport system permease component